MKRFDRKDPSETVVLTFDFTGEAPAVSAPTVTVTHESGDPDAAFASVLDGLPQVSGGKVLQRVKAGVAGADYLLRCMAGDGAGNVLVRAGLLMVRDA